MKLYATVENEKGKREGIGGNECLDIDIRVGNVKLAALTVRYTDELDEDEDTTSGWALYDEDDNIICWIGDKKENYIVVNSTDKEERVPFDSFAEAKQFAHDTNGTIEKGKKHSAK